MDLHKKALTKTLEQQPPRPRFCAWSQARRSDLQPVFHVIVVPPPGC